MQPEPSNQEGKCQESPSHDFVLPKVRHKIPMPKTGTWTKSSTTWEEFCQAAHRSIGRNLGGAVVTFCDESIASSERSPHLRQLLGKAPYFVGGDEHHVFHRSGARVPLI